MYKKNTFILVAIVVAFATLMCIYSNFLSDKSVEASRIFYNSGEICYAVDDCKDDCIDDTVDPDFFVKPEKGMHPKIKRPCPRPDCGDKISRQN